MQNRSLLRRTLPRIFVGSCLGIVAIIGWLILSVYSYSLKDDAQPAGAAIVLGAAVFRNRPSPVFRERINHAISLYEQGLVDTLIMTGGVGPRRSISEAEVARDYAIARGVPEEAILIETTSTSTYENLSNAQMVAEEAGVDSFVIVSTPNHMRRAMAIANSLDMEAHSSPTRTIRWTNWRTQTFSFVREVVAWGVYVGDGLLGRN